MESQPATAWALATANLPQGAIWRQCCAFWDSDGYPATRVVFELLILVGSRARGVDWATLNIPALPFPAPSDGLRDSMGGPGRSAKALAQGHRLVIGAMMAQATGVGDPLREHQLRAFSSTFHGASVFVFIWWTRSWLAIVAADGHDQHVQLLAAVHELLDQAPPTGAIPRRMPGQLGG